ncbi:MAG: hypothetical protein WHS82_05345 [Candidatus Methanosuratincola sp.]
MESSTYGIEAGDITKWPAAGLKRRKAMLKMLLHKGLVKIDVTRGEPVYRITTKGADFLRDYTELELYSRRFGALRLNV